LVQKEVAFNLLRQRYKAKHPEYIRAEQELAALQKSLSQAVLAAKEQLKLSLAAAEEHERMLQTQFAQKSKEARDLASEANEEADPIVDRQIQLNTVIRDKVMQRLTEASLAGDLFRNPLSVQQPAVTPRRPVSPDQVRVISIGVMVGLAVGMFCALLLGLSDTTLKSVDEAEALLVLCVIPRLKNTDTEQAAAEAFRSLRTSISVYAKGKDPKTLLFTSTSPDEGKTFCALNYAVGLAKQGLKIVLIECDLRRPRAAPSLAKVRTDGPGVSDYLKRVRRRPVAAPVDRAPRDASGLSFAELSRKRQGVAPEPTQPPAPASVPEEPASPVAKELELDDIIQKTEILNLSFIAAGKAVANPSELLVQQGIKGLLDDLLSRCDRVILDSAPMLGVSDTLLLASQVDGVCFVVRASESPKRAVLRAVEILRRADAPMLGAVLNCHTPSRTDPYGQRYYYHRTVERETS
jgi:Mrp family chromosome partitioning ATPase